MGYREVRLGNVAIKEGRRQLKNQKSCSLIRLCAKAVRVLWLFA